MENSLLGPNVSDLIRTLFFFIQCTCGGERKKGNPPLAHYWCEMLFLLLLKMMLVCLEKQKREF